MIITHCWRPSGALVCLGFAQANTQRFSDSGKAALSSQLSGAVSRGDTRGVVALVVGRDGVLYEGAAGKLDVAHDSWIACGSIRSGT
jgi:hypothetical protein